MINTLCFVVYYNLQYVRALLLYVHRSGDLDVILFAPLLDNPHNVLYLYVCTFNDEVGGGGRGRGRGS